MASNRRYGSIRARLCLWYALILVVTLTTLGGVLYTQQRGSVLGQVDDRIRTHCEAIAAASENDEEDGIELELSEDFLGMFRLEDEEQPYFVLYDSKGRVALNSRAGLDVPFPQSMGFRDRGLLREVAVRGPDGLTIAVGQHTGRPRAALARFLTVMVAAGLGVLGVALLGGWFLSGRVLDPIQRISQAAGAISASNLSQRIDLEQTESELGRLAGVLNETFDRLQQAFEQQTRFTADASHELRTPVAVVLTSAGQALERERTPEEYRESLEAVLRAARRMKGIVDGLLSLSRADAGAARFDREPVDLTELVAEINDLLGPLATEHGVTLAVSGPSLTVSGDRERLKEVFTNLIGNAIRYNRSGGEVHVSVSNGQDVVRAEIRDTGIGIDADQLPLLFDRFYRVDPARSRQQGGSGLGLSITRWIVEAHGGSIGVVSTPDEGTTFSVRLPSNGPAP